MQHDGEVEQRRERGPGRAVEQQVVAFDDHDRGRTRGSPARRRGRPPSARSNTGTAISSSWFARSRSSMARSPPTSKVCGAPLRGRHPRVQEQVVEMVAVHRQDLGEPGRARSAGRGERREGRLAGTGRPGDRDDRAAPARPSEQGRHQISGSVNLGPTRPLRSAVKGNQAEQCAALRPSRQARSARARRDGAHGALRRPAGPRGARPARQAGDQRRRCRTTSRAMRHFCPLMSTWCPINRAGRLSQSSRIGHLWRRSRSSNSLSVDRTHADGLEGSTNSIDGGVNLAVHRLRRAAEVMACDTRNQHAPQMRHSAIQSDAWVAHRKSMTGNSVQEADHHLGHAQSPDALLLAVSGKLRSRSFVCVAPSRHERWTAKQTWVSHINPKACIDAESSPATALLRPATASCRPPSTPRRPPPPPPRPSSAPPSAPGLATIPFRPRPSARLRSRLPSPPLRSPPRHFRPSPPPRRHSALPAALPPSALPRRRHSARPFHPLRRRRPPPVCGHEFPRSHGPSEDVVNGPGLTPG